MRFTISRPDDLERQDRDDRREVERPDPQRQPAEDAQVRLGDIAQEVQHGVDGAARYGTRAPSANTNDTTIQAMMMIT